MQLIVWGAALRLNQVLVACLRWAWERHTAEEEQPCPYVSLGHGCRHAQQIRNHMKNEKCRTAPLSTFILASVSHWVHRAVLGDAMVG